jgi:hypothetical protein
MEYDIECFCYILLGDCPASEFDVPKFRNTVTFARPMKMEQTVFRTSAHQIQTPGSHPKERVQHSQHGELFSGFVIPFFVRLFVQ